MSEIGKCTYDFKIIYINSIIIFSLPVVVHTAANHVVVTYLVFLLVVPAVELLDCPVDRRSFTEDLLALLVNKHSKGCGIYRGKTPI